MNYDVSSCDVIDSAVFPKASIHTTYSSSLEVWLSISSCLNRIPALLNTAAYKNSFLLVPKKSVEIRDPGIGNSDLWYKYNEGFSNAVRRKVYVKDFM